MSRIAFLGLVATLIATPSQADTAAGLLKACNAYEAVEAHQSDDYMVAMRCRAYVEGVMDFLFIAKVGGWIRCPMLPDGISYDQGVLIVTKHLRDNPGKLHEQAGFTAFEAFVSAYPCPQ